MARYNDHGELMCEAHGCQKPANGQVEGINEDTLKRETRYFCFEHLDARNKALH